MWDETWQMPSVPYADASRLSLGWRDGTQAVQNNNILEDGTEDQIWPKGLQATPVTSRSVNLGPLGWLQILVASSGEEEDPACMRGNVEGNSIS